MLCARINVSFTAAVQTVLQATAEIADVTVSQSLKRIMSADLTTGGRLLPYWAIRRRAARQGMVCWSNSVLNRIYNSLLASVLRAEGHKP